jgi:hypothetical protein
MCLSCYATKASEELDAAKLAASKVGMVKDVVVLFEKQAMC